MLDLPLSLFELGVHLLLRVTDGDPERLLPFVELRLPLFCLQLELRHGALRLRKLFLDLVHFVFQEFNLLFIIFHHGFELLHSLLLLVLKLFLPDNILLAVLLKKLADLAVDLIHFRERFHFYFEQVAEVADAPAPF